jgi:hypothetical protein
MDLGGEFSLRKEARRRIGGVERAQLERRTQEIRYLPEILFALGDN